MKKKFIKKAFIIITVIILSFVVIMPKNTYAVPTNEDSSISVTQDANEFINSVKDNNQYDPDIDKCDSILGDPNKKNTVAYLLFKILNYIRILGPLIVIVLSGIEFTRAIINSDDDTMKKATSHLKTRLVMVALLFLIPTITKLLFQIFGIATDCGLIG